MQQQMDLLADLTTPQREAVTFQDGPMLVLAGPGSGKTRVITHRIAYLISQGVRPGNILAITFTNKAAQEMRQRVQALNATPGSTICTFHSLAARLLREFADRAGLARDFSIYDEADQKSALRQVLKLCEMDSQNYPPRRVLTHISRWKNKFMTPELLNPDELDFFDNRVALIYKAYQEYLTANAALDFDDLLMRFALLLRDDQEFRDLMNNRYRYILVDEYQDTNSCQYQIARGLALNHSNLVVTGDPDQSIYGWRGADIGNILAFEEDYPDAHIVRLEENFRSTPEVLTLADQIIKANYQRKDKQLFTAKSSGPPCELVEYYDEKEEAQGMVRWIQQCRHESLQFRDLAVFYRVNSMSRALEEALRKDRIPYQIIRGIEFFQRREIKDLLAYLRLIVNPSDQVALRRIINQPTRGIGNTTVKRLFDHCQSTGLDIQLVLADPDQVPNLNSAAKKRVKKFAELIKHLQEQADNSVSQIVQLVYETSGLARFYAEEKNEDAVNNVNELCNSAALYENETSEPSLADYLQQIALISDTDAYDGQAGCVNLMTLHAAKGLEFPAVLIIGVEEGLIPHSRREESDNDIEEERRLLFVGLTRAQEKLTLSYTRNRMQQGSRKASIPSRFVRNIPSLVCHTSDYDYSFDDDSDEFSDLEPNNSSANEWESIPDDDFLSFSSLTRGQLVRHPSLGVGRIQKLSLVRDNPKAEVQFRSGLRRTLYLKYAHLEPFDRHNA